MEPAGAHCGGHTQPAVWSSPFVISLWLLTRDWRTRTAGGLGPVHVVRQLGNASLDARDTGLDSCVLKLATRIQK